VTDYFSSSYRQGRARFLSAAGQAGGAIESFVHPAIKGPHGEDLAIDCARFGRIDAPRLLLASCGLHGLEAAAGSATMLQWLALGGSNCGCMKACACAGGSFQAGGQPPGAACALGASASAQAASRASAAVAGARVEKNMNRGAPIVVLLFLKGTALDTGQAAERGEDAVTAG